MGNQAPGASSGFPGGTGVKNLPVNAGDARDVGSVPGSGRSSGKGDGNPLQYSCRENPMDRGAWPARVHEVTKSQTRLRGWARSRLCTESSALLTTHNYGLGQEKIWNNFIFFTLWSRHFFFIFLINLNFFLVFIEFVAILLLYCIVGREVGRRPCMHVGS